MDLVKYVQDTFVQKKDFPKFRAGDTITVYYEIREGNKTRTQFFRGVVIQVRGEGVTKTFTIRKMSGTVGVERIFPFNMPALQKIELNKSGKVRRARIFYLRALTGKKHVSRNVLFRGNTPLFNTNGRRQKTSAIFAEVFLLFFLSE